MKIKKTSIVLSSLLLVALPTIASVSCGTRNNDERNLEYLKNIYNSKKVTSNYSLSMGHYPQNITENGKQVINLGVITSSLKSYQNWKTQPNKVSGSTFKALYDIVNTFNKNNNKIVVKIEEFDNVNDMKAIMSTRNSVKPIPNLIFGNQNTLISLNNFKNIFKQMDSSTLGILSKYSINNFLPLADDPLVAAVDFKLMNGLLFAYNKHIDPSYVTKGIDESSKLVPLTDALMTSVMDNGNIKTLKNLTFKSNIFGDSTITYQKLINDSRLFMKFASEIHKLNTNVEWTVGTSFPGLTLYSLSSSSGNQELNSIDKDLFNGFSKLFQNDSIHYKRNDTYNTGKLPTSDIMIDFTKSYALKYFLSNKNTTYIPTPGFSLSNLIGFKMIDSKNQAEEDSINEFIKYVYTGNLESNQFTTATFGGKTIGVNPGDTITPIEYYSLWTQKHTVKQESQYFKSTISNHSEKYRANKKLTSIFTTDLNPNPKNIYIDDTTDIYTLNDSLGEYIASLN